MDEIATIALANFDARIRFDARAARVNLRRAQVLLDKLDKAEFQVLPTQSKSE